MSKQTLKKLSDDTFPTNGTRQITAKNLRDYNNSSIDEMYLNVSSVIVWAGLIANIPTNWMRCGGQQLSKVDYPELFTALGGELSPYGVQPTTFNLPEIPLYGIPIQGATADFGQGDLNKGSKGGEKEHRLNINEMPSHYHSYTDSIVTYTPALGTIGSGSVIETRGEEKNTSLTGDGFAHNNMPPYIVMTWIIKVK